MQRREQLTNINDLDMFDLRFGKPQTFKIPDSDRTYDRVPIVIHYGDATFGSLLLKTEKCFSFGAQQNINKETGETHGWTLPISMYDREEATPEQLLFVQKLRDVIKHCKDHIREEYLLDDVSLEKLGGCLWQPDDAGIQRTNTICKDYKCKEWKHTIRLTLLEGQRLDKKVQAKTSDKGRNH